MRISDWSSACALPISTRISDCDVPGSAAPSRPPSPAPAAPPKRSSPPEPHRSSVSSCSWTAPSEHDGTARPPINSPVRSEEHTSELQSLMRTSYAVFCLKKKKNKIYQLLHDSKTATKTNHTEHEQPANIQSL